MKRSHFIVPLDLIDLQSLVADPPQFDGTPVARGALPPSIIMERAIEALRDGRPPLWFAPFAFLRKRPRRLMGTGGFKGAPVLRRVEIGYGVAEMFRGQGVATAGVVHLLRAAFAETEVTEVYAETALGNAPSRRVVEKTGFRHLGRRDTSDDGIVDRWLKCR